MSKADLCNMRKQHELIHRFVKIHISIYIFIVEVARRGTQAQVR